MNVNLKSLVGRLNDVSRGALEGAAGLCLSRTNYDVEVEHILAKILENNDTDLHKIAAHYEINIDRLSKDVSTSLDKLKTGNSRTPGLSDRITEWIQNAWLLASVDFGAARVRSGHLILALLASGSMSRIARDISKEFDHISIEDLQKKLVEITAESAEARDAVALGEAAGVSDGSPVTSGIAGKTKSLDQYTEDLTAKARAGKIDPVLGRDFEIRQIVDILTRRRQNNPILTGEAGVGKTAVVEGFALRIAEGDVPDPLKNVAVRTLDLGLLQAGAGVKGEFENRLKSVIDEVKSSPQPIIMFIDEAHTMIGAGGAAGQNDAANLLKPALARGELRTIAATTWAEYKKYFEKDAALARRFQVVKVDEPDELKAIAMMRGIADKMEGHHNVRILDEAIVDCVKLSHRYITGRQLPDKSVSVLDTACAKVAIGQGSIPAPIDDVKRRMQNLDSEINSLEREQVTGAGHDERLDLLKKDRVAAEAELAKFSEQFEKEKTLVEQIKAVRTKLELSRLDEKLGDAVAASNGNGNGEAMAAAATGEADGVPSGDDTAAAPAPVDLEASKAELKRLTEELKVLQGENPLIQPVVNGQSVAEIISGWTGIPIGKMVADEINAVLHLHETLRERVLGQDHALEAIAQRIRTSRAGLTDPKRPIGVFMLVGTSGVGKTETALALAESLYGGERNLISINMSEYQEAHTVSSLKGSPPGYVGYGEGGVLTEAVRRKPYSVVLLDETEKAHPDVMELFFQVFDKGVLEDGEGREIDFKNCVIILTSNVGTDTIMKLCADPETRPDPDGILEAIKPEMNKAFKPALLGRMVTVPFYPISDDILRLIIKLQLGKIKNRIADNHAAQFSYDDAVIETVAKRCTDVDSGARNVYNILTGTMLPDMSGEVLSRMAAGESIKKVHVGVGEGEKFVYDIS